MKSFRTLLTFVVMLGLATPLLAEPGDNLRRLALSRLVIPKFQVRNAPLDVAIARLAETANAARPEGANPVTIRIAADSQFLKPSVTTDIRGQSLDTILEFLTEHVGFEWRIEGRDVVLYTNGQLRELHRRLIAMPGRAVLFQAVVPRFKVQEAEMTEALRQLEIVARAAGVRNVLANDKAIEIVADFRPQPGQDYIVSANFENANLDTIIEILTKQTRKLDWTIASDGNISVFDKAQAEYRRAVARAKMEERMRPKRSGGADPFADLGGGGSYVPPPREPDLAPPGADPNFNTESYQSLRDNPFLSPLNEPLSTFSIDVDTASYSNIRRFIFELGQKPPIGAVRIEELINYFDYAYAPPPQAANPLHPEIPVEHPFAAHVEVAASPWKPDHRLVRIGLKGYELPPEKRPSSNLVFLLDVSGSMSPENKLPLVKKSLKLLLERLGPDDRVAIVVYAGASGLALPSTSVRNSAAIEQAMNRLQSGGSTNGGEGIALAYKVARDNFLEKGNNRVILCSDGDFNVGVTDQDSLKKLVMDNAKANVQLSILGFGMGNLKDDTMETLSNYGDGNYGYIDGMGEAEKLFVNRLAGTLFTIAKDVKIQVEFNPAHVAAYRLIGYENRLLRNRDFADDKIDAGDIGAGHTVTALYEIVPPGVKLPDQPGKIDLKYQKTRVTGAEASGEMLTLKLRYKWPGETVSRLLQTPVKPADVEFEQASNDFQFASAVAGFGMILRRSPHCGQFSFEDVVAIAKANLAEDRFGERKEFVELAEVFFW